MTMDVSLQDMKPGDSARVVGFAKGERDYRQRLLAMGLTPGAEFSVTRVAPMGDPVEITVRNFTLTLRKAEAAILRAKRT
ncbi:Ferrous iron transport protein A [Paramagnetospirillum magneticum AMB-1]|uniref:Ferrous iron transport protein A n=2 Tax=Paramagnetospirillum magneticum TaxID=84159 RepID=Q2W3N9_PARM1|nr:Ferrous iron transport protein A [Paramagnetospirillum magneticum AMB-1]